MSPRLDSTALVRFLAVAETLSFREAAERLHMSQPPLSRAIRELEARLGVALFERDTHRVALTPRGQALLPLARNIVARLAEAEAAMTAQPQALTMLRLGMTTAAEPAWYRSLLARLSQAFPGLEVRRTAASSPALVQQLRRGRLDAAFIALPTEAAGLEITEIERQPMCVALPTAHPLARRRRLSLQDLSGTPLFWFERRRQPAFFDHCRRVFERHGFVARTTLPEPEDHHVLLAEIAAARGVALLPISFKTFSRQGVVYRSLVEGDELAVGIGLAHTASKASWRPALLAAASLGDA
ncbi:MAG TPA: LysR family transcriptional regulator [Burkholderiaceae bacterium]|jgi:DNA-binding transcriptional LysR family regulator